MAKKQRSSSYDPQRGQYKATPNRPVKVSFSEFRFVRIELSESEKNEFRAMLAAGEYDELAFDDLLREGYKHTRSFDDTHNTYISTLTAQYKDMPDSGLVLTARGSSTAVADALLRHKHGYICGDDGWAAAETARGGSYDDIG